MNGGLPAGKAESGEARFIRRELDEGEAWSTAARRVRVDARPVRLLWDFFRN